MIKFIEEFKKSPSLYSLLGSRFNLAEGESCATVAHACLLEGNFSQLLDFIPSQFLSERAILTPTSLKDYCEIARSTEHSFSPEIVKISDDFQTMFKTEMDNLSRKLEQDQSAIDSDVSRPSATKS